MYNRLPAVCIRESGEIGQGYRTRDSWHTQGNDVVRLLVRLWDLLTYTMSFRQLMYCLSVFFQLLNTQGCVGRPRRILNLRAPIWAFWRSRVLTRKLLHATWEGTCINYLLHPNTQFGLELFHIMNFSLMAKASVKKIYSTFWKHIHCV